MGAGGRYSLAEWSARRTCYPQAVPASSPSPTTSLTCLFCRSRLQITNWFSPATGVPVMGSIGLFSSIHLSGVPAGQLER